MGSCRKVEFLYRAVPLRTFRDLLIRAHMDRCGRCRVRLASREEARGLFVGAGDVGPVDDLWRRIADRAVREPEAPARSTAARVAGWRWAAAVTVVVAATGFWLLDQVGRPGHGPGFARADDNFRIDYVNVGGAPAQTFVYQPLGSDTVFVWAQRAP